MGLLDGKVAAITGAGRGIGRAHALLFAAEGASVVVNDLGGARDGAGADGGLASALADEICARGGRAIANTADISTAQGADSVVQAAVDAFGKLDIMVNNAGILRDKTLRKMTDDMWSAVIRVHLDGTFFGTRAAARHMIDRGKGGRIINTTSISGMRGNFGQTNYAAAKAGIYGLTLTAAIELNRYQITVNALAPIALTRMTDDLPSMQASETDQRLAPDHIAPAALFLASELASELTGQILSVEGTKLSVYKISQTEGRPPRDGAAWTAREIGQRWAEIADAQT